VMTEDCAAGVGGVGDRGFVMYDAVVDRIAENVDGGANLLNLGAFCSAGATGGEGTAVEGDTGKESLMGGAVVGGAAIGGDEIGGDKIGGDEIGGDEIGDEIGGVAIAETGAGGAAL
jgi:hypothetical protein